MINSSSLLRGGSQIIADALVSALCLIGTTAHASASLIGDTVDVSLTSPIDSVAAATLVPVISAGTSISAGDCTTYIATEVQCQMATGSTQQESINFNALSITLQLLAGGYDNNGDPTTGWSAGAMYQFSDLDIAGNTITGVSVDASSTQIANLSTLDSEDWVSLIDPNEITLALSDIVFEPAAAGTTYADVTINLLTTPNGGGGGNVPEPATLALCGLALAGLTAARRVSPGAHR